MRINSVLVVTTGCICLLVSVIALVVSLTRPSSAQAVGDCPTGVAHIYTESRNGDFTGGASWHRIIVLCKDGRMFEP